ncbi:DeoR/GlpR family DNA-binding transcription regulator [Rhizobium sp. XQZ8]|uniref:DeoR/GlpR family DNA-binding transcription regulator n=1 Tax=Rhizobium populisoli TaxID=2859785 RepID=UPI001C672162|nr:DeoR/GlpR family DNA-binding transcription regulator [Rhizobium populisoli]MBW6424867.1 DeoR/GlpR family DNA-binding transcription regulator [Rhizobium populisoli]
MSGVASPGSEQSEDSGDSPRRTERQAAILESVRKNGAASVGDLAREFGVTQQTIRRDLKSLNDSGLLQKGFGGAFASPGVPHFVRGERQNLLVSVKRRLVQALEQFIQPNTTMFIGLGTTFDSLYEILARHPGVFIATPNLEVAYSCAMKTEASVYIYGGYVRSKDPTILTVPDESRNRFKFDIAVLGASAIDEDGAVLEFDPLEIELVQAILPHSRQVILVAHDEKFGKRAPHRVTNLGSIDVLITNSGALEKLTPTAIPDALKIVSIE